MNKLYFDEWDTFESHFVHLTFFFFYLFMNMLFFIFMNVLFLFLYSVFTPVSCRFISIYSPYIRIQYSEIS